MFGRIVAFPTTVALLYGSVLVSGFLPGIRSKKPWWWLRCSRAPHSLFTNLNDTYDVLAVSDLDPEAIAQAAAFLVDSFWLGSPRQWTNPTDVESTISDDLWKTLVNEQALDLSDKYGEILGSRPLESSLVLATPGDGSVLGLLGVQELLLDSSKGDILSAEDSELKLRDAVASLGPKQRREYKGASSRLIASELLPPSLHLVCCISNLAVAPAARRRGVAIRMCQHVEKLVADDWNHGQVYLKVERENEGARNLYESKLGYEVDTLVEADKAVRLNKDVGEFVERTTDALLLRKTLY